MQDFKLEGKSQFESARFKSLLNNIRLSLRDESNELLSFEEINRGLELHNQRYFGIRAVKLKNIVGSIDRYRDFDRYFLPKKAHLERRWSNIYNAYKKDMFLPAVKLYKVGDIYFVLDGNHRVSVARRMGMVYIDAEVIEFKTRVPITREMDPKDMFILYEREKFLDLTGLREKRPDIKIRLTIPGKYDFLLNQIDNHMYYLNSRDIKNNKKYSFKDAALDWYDNIYLPSIKVIDRYGIIENFPNRTKSDLYVWINAHKYYLREKYGDDIGLSDAAFDFSKRFSEGFLPGVKLFFSNLLKNLIRRNK
jgi:hypothetical protein